MGTVHEILVTLPGGRRVDAKIAQHTIHTDQPIGNGGEDTGPSPFDLFLGSIGACAGIFVQGFCAKRGIHSEEIRIAEHVRFKEDGTLQTIDLDVQLPPSFPEKYRSALVKVVEQCSVKRAILSPPSFQVRTTQAQPTPAAA
jgi:ribosomal protein S12 methylthiotransferase accessory factor